MPQRDVKKLLLSKPVRWLLVAALVTSAARGGDPLPASPKSEHADKPAPATQGEKPDRTAGSLAWQSPAAPKPAPANRNQLAAAFNKTTPASLADLKSIEQRVKELVRRVSPAVVDVEIGTGTGSGVIVSPDGLVLTAGHVCGDPGRKVRMTFSDGRKARGETLRASQDRDCGLLRITERGPWPYVPMGDLEQARAGDWVLALGHPGGFDPKRSLVVRLGRIIQLEEGNLQTDCTITQGDSGGPLIDMFGRVIGIHSYISLSLTANFHVAITEFYQNWDEMVKKFATRPSND